MKMKLFKMFAVSTHVRILLLFMSFFLQGARSDVADSSFLLNLKPPSKLNFRSQGVIHWSTKLNGDESHQNVFEYAFGESADSRQKRYIVNISSISSMRTDTIAYNSIDQTNTIVLEPKGECLKLEGINFIPELNDIQSDLIIYDSRESPYLIGPSGLIEFLLKSKNLPNVSLNSTPSPIEPLSLAAKLTSIHEQSHNSSEVKYMGIDCVEVKVDKEIDEGRVVSLSVMVLKSKIGMPHLENVLKIDANWMMRNNDQIMTRLTIEFSSFQSRPNLNDKSMMKDFNLPLAAGCSSLVPKLHIKWPSGRNRILIRFNELDHNEAMINEQLFAYDQNSKYITREFTTDQDKLRIVWDLNEKFMYSIDLNEETCAIIQIADSKLSPALRPMLSGDEIPDPLSIIAGNEFSYMGQDIVRGLEISIYEHIVDREEIPILFGLSVEEMAKYGANSEYLVQIYQTDSNTNSLAQLNLYFRSSKDDQFKAIRRYEVTEFIGDLIGDEISASELFKASECFKTDAEELKLEFLVTFDDVHPTPKNEDYETILNRNKYQITKNILSTIMKKLSLNLLHLVSYEFEFTDSHIDSEIVIADQRFADKLTYLGQTGEPSPTVIQGLSDEFEVSDIRECIIKGALSDAMTVFYCSQPESPGFKCSHSRQSFVQPKESQNLTCSVYKLDEIRLKGETSAIDFDEISFKDVHFNVDAYLKSGSKNVVKLSGSVRRFDLVRQARVESISDHSYVLTQSSPDQLSLTNSSTRTISSMNFKSQEVCEEACGQDINCLSYSYCLERSGKPRCILSSLDIVAWNTKDKITLPRPDSDKILVEGADGLDYELEFSMDCRIFEFNHLTRFRQTDEILPLEKHYKNQYRTTSSSVECAKLSTESERNNPNDKISRFAFCSLTRNCILDQNLISKVFDNSEPDDSESESYVCRIFRKKYKAHFIVSTKIIKSPVESQIKEKSQSTDDCAKKCLFESDDKCLSFDFCPPNDCRLNPISSATPGVELETNQGCLHYNLSSNFYRRPLETGKSDNHIHEIVLCIIAVVSTLAGFMLWNPISKGMKSLKSLSSRPQNEGSNNSRSTRKMFGFSKFQNESTSERTGIQMSDMG